MAISEKEKKSRNKFLSKLVSDEKMNKVVKAVEEYMVDNREIEYENNKGVR